MRALLQRVSRASVRVDSDAVGAIDIGWAILLGVRKTDTEQTARRLAGRVAHLRGFSDDQDRLNLSVLDVSGAALVVSQVTLYADTTRGRRPSFSEAAPLDLASHLVDAFASSLSELGVTVETGRFRAHMVVELANDGPVTFLLTEEEGGQDVNPTTRG